MAVSETPRHNLRKYGAGTDPHPNRSVFNSEVDKLDALPMLKEGSAGTRPTAGMGRSLYWDQANKRMSYDDGTAWQEIAPVGGATPGNVAAGKDPTEGTSPRAARADHTHKLLLATSVTAGAMSSVDKGKLDTAVPTIVAGALVMRDDFGQIDTPAPTGPTHSTNKSYVDGRTRPLAEREPTVLGARENLNLKTTTQNYVQNFTTSATDGQNYPVPLAGYLEVVGHPTGSYIYQSYHTYGPTNRKFHRAAYIGTWSPWEEVATKSYIDQAIAAALAKP